MNALRAALEHTIYIEAAFYADGSLDEKSAKLVEMPASESEESFSQWIRKRKKNGPAALKQGAELLKRVYDLQPLHRRNYPKAHPLSRLVAYTNHAKHRTPAVTAVRVPAVTRDDMPPRNPRDIPKRSEVPVKAGEIIFSAETDQVVPVAIFPTVGIKLPNTARWPVLMIELGQITEWVRKQAIPRLITGLDPPEPEIPVWFDISRGVIDSRTVFASGSTVSAFDRSDDRLQAATARIGMIETISLIPEAPPRKDIRAWLNSLADREILNRTRKLVESYWV